MFMSTILVSLSCLLTPPEAPPDLYPTYVEWVQVNAATNEVLSLKEATSDSTCIGKAIYKQLPDGTVELQDLLCESKPGQCKRGCNREIKQVLPGVNEIRCRCPAK